MITPTYKLAMAAGQDAGNRHMQRDNRTQWNDSDWQVACEVASFLLQTVLDEQSLVNLPPYAARNES